MDPTPTRNTLLINEQGWWGYTALHRAILSTNGSLITELLRIPGIEVNIQCETGETAFHLAVKSLSVTIVQQLLEQHTCNITLLSGGGHGHSVFHYATGRIDMLELLLCARTKLIESGTPGSTELINLGSMTTPLQHAVRHWNTAAVHILL